MAKKVLKKNTRPSLRVSRLKKPVTKPVEPKSSSQGYLDKIENEISSNQSKVSMVLGALIILILGILIFNYFKGNKSTLGPAQQTQESQTEQQQDVAQDKLPGPYTVKADDTLFTIAQKYYSDGEKFPEIAKANNLTNPDQIELGQVLQIPRLETQPEASPSSQPSSTPEVSATPEPSASPEPSPSIEPSVSPSPIVMDNESQGTGGGNTTIWGPKIEGDKYTVQEGDWLTTISARAYGDIQAFEKIAKANNIQNPNHIEPGWVLVIPR